SGPEGNWNYPNSIRAGAGRIAELPEACRVLGMRAPLLVTDPQLAALPLVQDAVGRCRAADLACEVFSAIRSNPNGSNVEEGIVAFKRGKHDGVIAMGGGSALDAGKAIALMSGQDLPLWEFEDIGDNWSRVRPDGIAPIVAVPTTAGTGSEVGRAAVITDQQQQVKRIIFHPGMLPGQVILDPELTSGLPARLTAATGMDALSHNLEALCSPAWHPMATGIAMEGIRLVHDFLPVAVSDGGNLEARMQMLAASSMGATAFQKGLGAMHALAHPLGAVYDAHHGLLNAILMPYVLQANETAIAPIITRAAAYVGLERSDFNGFLEWILALRSTIGIPESLAKIGIGDEQIDRIAGMAVEDPSAAGNPIPFSIDQYAQILQRAIDGEL
ncbi:MAG: iron-containing alcohol dehydrogenase, partial [Halieaceae bacterium]|nr:iron-containing alcohol dehydrogenase [Halieaceae bacterium]